METLKQNIEAMYAPDTTLTLDQYNRLLKECVHYREMAAVVFVYDHMLKSKTKPTETTFKLIEKLHSKTVPESTEIYIKFRKSSALQPRRRIHKIIKGHNYSDSYNDALVHLDKVQLFLRGNPRIKATANRHKLAKKISQGCQISVRDARYIVTKLKRTKFLTKGVVVAGSGVGRSATTPSKGTFAAMNDGFSTTKSRKTPSIGSGGHQNSILNYFKRV